MDPEPHPQRVPVSYFDHPYLVCCRDLISLERQKPERELRDHRNNSGRPESSVRLWGNRKEGSKTLDVVGYSRLSQSSPECSCIARNYWLAKYDFNLLGKGGSRKICTTQEKRLSVGMVYGQGVPVNLLFRYFRKLAAQFRFNGIEGHSRHFQNFYAVSFQKFLLMLVGGIRVGSCQGNTVGFQCL